MKAFSQQWICSRSRGFAGTTALLSLKPRVSYGSARAGAAGGERALASPGPPLAPLFAPIFPWWDFFSPLTFFLPLPADEMKRRRDFYAAYPVAEGECPLRGPPLTPAVPPHSGSAPPSLCSRSSQRVQRRPRGSIRAGQGEPDRRRDRQPVHRVLRRVKVPFSGCSRGVGINSHPFFPLWRRAEM